MKIDILEQGYKIPKFIISANALYELSHYMNTSFAKTLEFMWLGEVTKKRNTYILEKIQIIPQENNSATFCTTHDEEYAEWLFKHYPNPQDRKKLRLYGHSHVNMSTHPSGLDDLQFDKFYKLVDDYFIQMIFNHKYECTINIIDKKQMLKFSGIETIIQSPNRTEFKLKTLSPLTFKNNIKITKKSKNSITLSNGLEVLLDEKVKTTFNFKDDWFKINSQTLSIEFDSTFQNLCSMNITKNIIVTKTLTKTYTPLPVNQILNHAGNYGLVDYYNDQSINQVYAPLPKQNKKGKKNHGFK